MNFRSVFSKILIFSLSVILLLSVSDYALAYFDGLIESNSETIPVGVWDAATPISTPQEFYDFANSSTSTSADRYYLTQSIDFTGFTWDYNSSFNSNIFRGEFNGNDYTLSNITITSTDTGAIGVSIFTAMNGAIIKNVKIENFAMGFILAHFNATLLESAVFVSNVTGTDNFIENITLSDVEVIGNSLDGAGGLVTSVKAGADITIRNIKATEVTVLNTSKRVGGIVCRVFAGSGIVIIEDVEFQGYLGSDNKVSNTGGILGTAQNTNISITRVIVDYIGEGTVTLADGTKTIKSDKYSGGIVGNNNSHSLAITDAFFTGTLYNNIKNMGAFVGREKASAVLVNAFYSNVLFKDSYSAPTTTTGLHGTVVNASSMPSVSWWNTFALNFSSANSLWTQDANGQLELIR